MASSLPRDVGGCARRTLQWPRPSSGLSPSILRASQSVRCRIDLCKDHSVIDVPSSGGITVYTIRLDQAGVVGKLYRIGENREPYSVPVETEYGSDSQPSTMNLVNRSLKELAPSNKYRTVARQVVQHWRKLSKKRVESSDPDGVLQSFAMR